MFSITRRNSNAEEKVSKEDGSGEEGLKDEYRAMVLPIEEQRSKVNQISSAVESQLNPFQTGMSFYGEQGKLVTPADQQRVVL